MIKTQLTPKVKKMKAQTCGQGCNCSSLCERNCAVYYYVRTNFSLRKIRKVNDIEEIDARAACSELPEYQTEVCTQQQRRKFWPKFKRRLIFVMDFNLPSYLYSSPQDHPHRNKKKTKHSKCSVPAFEKYMCGFW